MNKNRLIALTLAAIYTQRAADMDSPQGLINTHDGVTLHFSSSTLDYLRDKEGKGTTKPDSKAVTKIAKQLWKRHRICMEVGVLMNKDKTFSFALTRTIESVKEPFANSVLQRHSAVIGVETEYVAATTTFREIVNLNKLSKKDKLSKDEKKSRDAKIQALIDNATVKRVSGEVAQAA